ncbi:hypothetical protein [Helicobacter bilis]|nr:hypothetical protein [Helicobacter bilis]
MRVETKTDSSNCIMALIALRLFYSRSYLSDNDYYKKALIC